MVRTKFHLLCSRLCNIHKINVELQIDDRGLKLDQSTLSSPLAESARRSFAIEGERHLIRTFKFN